MDRERREDDDGAFIPQLLPYVATTLVTLTRFVLVKRGPISQITDWIADGVKFCLATMSFKLPPLPYGMNALAPYISQETLEYHYGKHHAAYLSKLNSLVQNKPLASLTLDEIVKKKSELPAGVYNSAAQALK
jgi:hypothetical protein